MKKLLVGVLLGVSVAVGAATETDLHVVDVLLAFDRSAEQWLVDNGKGSVDAFAREKIVEMNGCLGNSGLTGDFTFRLAGTMVVDADTSSLGLVDILVDLQAGKSPYQGVLDKRETVGADLVSFLTGGSIKDDVRGIGYTLQNKGDTVSNMAKYGFNVCALQAVAASGDYTLIHEIAHNMGCGHADGIAGDERYYSYSYGSFITGNSGRWVSIMGYQDGTYTWIPYFSSPNVFYDGVATGDATHDNVRTLRENYQLIAQYRVSVSTSGSGSSETGVDGDAFNPSKAATWSGAVYSDGQPSGVAQLKIGKASKGVSRVSITVIGLDGKKYAFKAVKVKTEAGSKATFENRDLGRLTVTFGATSFVGAFDNGDVLKPVTESAAVTDAVATFEPANLATITGVLTDYLPTAEAVTRTEKKWTVAAKAGKLKYVKPNAKKGIAGGLQATGTNIAGLKLTYAAKTQTFKGSFKIWTFDSAKNKLKSVSATVTGVVVNGTGYGQVTVKKAKVGSLNVE